MAVQLNHTIVGAVDADQEVSLTTTYPKFIEAGAPFTIIAESSPTNVPTSNGN